MFSVHLNDILLLVNMFSVHFNDILLLVNLFSVHFNDILLLVNMFSVHFNDILLLVNMFSNMFDKIMHTSWSGIGEVACVFKGHPSNFKITREENRQIWPEFSIYGLEL